MVSTWITSKYFYEKEWLDADARNENRVYTTNT
jgi:hypothetical protein